MIGIIDEHNRLSGYRFVIVEYLLVGLLLGLLGVWYATLERFVDAATWLGMAANCAVIALIADATLRAGAADLGVLPLRHRSFRDAVRRDHPHMWLRTLLLVTITFVPFLVVAVSTVEMLRDGCTGSRSHRNVRSPATHRTSD